VGLASGLAFGAYPYSYYPYYSNAAYDYGDCYIVRRRVLTAWGDVVVRRRWVCA
jgi:hypothetical protein